jgi:hypothetical protein
MGVLFVPVKELLLRALGYLGNFLIAVIVFVVGWIVARIIRTLVVKLLKILKIDSIAEQAKIAEFLSKGGLKYTLSEIIGIIIYWVILLGVLISSLNILSLVGVSNLLDRLLGYLPNVISALFVLLLGTALSSFVSSIVRTAVANVGIGQVNLLSRVAQIAILVFTVVIVLDLLKIGAVLIAAMNIVLASLGLAFALAFGLGCREIAGKFVAELVEKIKKK